MTPRETILNAMPKGRPVTANDMVNRTKGKLPPGWGRQDVVQAMMAIGKRDDVEVTTTRDKSITIYERSA